MNVVQEDDLETKEKGSIIRTIILMQIDLSKYLHKQFKKIKMLARNDDVS